MKRSEFFSEMGKGMFRTMKEITAPLLTDELDKLDSLVEQVSGLKWLEIGLADAFKLGDIHDIFVGGKSIAVLTDASGLAAYEKVCSSCKSMVQWISYEKKYTCFHCEKSFYIHNNNGELCLQKYPLKASDGKLYIGVI